MKAFQRLWQLHQSVAVTRGRVEEVLLPITCTGARVWKVIAAYQKGRPISVAVFIHDFFQGWKSTLIRRINHCLSCNLNPLWLSVMLISVILTKGSAADLIIFFYEHNCFSCSCRFFEILDSFHLQPLQGCNYSLNTLWNLSSMNRVTTVSIQDGV